MGNLQFLAEGAIVTSSNGDLIAGIFNNFNNEALTSGDHYLIVNNYKDSIIIRQPMGADTPLAVEKPIFLDRHFESQGIFCWEIKPY